MIKPAGDVELRVAYGQVRGMLIVTITLHTWQLPVWSFKVLAVHPSLSGKPVRHVVGALNSPSTIARMLPGHDVEH